jgi:hypothetical protein
MNEIKGYAIVKSDADLSKAMHSGSNNIFDDRSQDEIQKELKDIWIGKPIRCLEINHSSKSILALSSDATKMAMFDLKDTSTFFECHEEGGIICPPKMEMVERIFYMSKVMNRKGGHNPIVRSLVIGHSLHKGEFCDSVLWAKQ